MTRTTLEGWSESKNRGSRPNKTPAQALGRRPEHRFSTTLLWISAVALVFAACSDGVVPDSQSTNLSPPADATMVTSAAPEPTVGAPEPTVAPPFPVTVAADNGVVIVEARPQRVAALSATHVEMLYAMGAGRQLIAGDLFSNYPPEAGELIQVDSFNVNIEALIDVNPDLVIIAFDPGDVVATLEVVGIPALLLGTASSLQDMYSQITAVGAATGNRAEAEALAAAIESDMSAVIQELGGAGLGLTFYHEADPFTFFTPNSQSFIGGLYAALGMENIADAAPDELGGGFPQLSPEFIVNANPDLIFLAGGEDAAAVMARDGWGSMTAVAAERIYQLDLDVASRWGPRVVDLLRAIAAAVLDGVG